MIIILNNSILDKFQNKFDIFFFIMDTQNMLTSNFKIINSTQQTERCDSKTRLRYYSFNGKNFPSDGLLW